MFASFYLRFEGELFTERLPLLLRILPYFIAFSVVVCYIFHLTTTKWRFISLPDALNILRAATVLTVALLVLDYIFVAPNVKGTFFLGKITIVLYWFLEVFFLSALALCLSLFSLYARASSCAGGGCVADAADRPRRRCRNSFARNRKRRRQADLAGRPVVAVDGRSRPVDPQYSGAGRDRRYRGRDRRFRKAQQADRARGHDAVGVRPRGAPRSRSDARAPAGADRQPPAIAGERGDAAADDGCRRGPAAAPQRKHRLRAARSSGEEQGGHRHRRWRFDRFGDLRPRRDIRRGAVAGDREFRAGALCRDRSAGGAPAPAL